ncbi:MAG TPA: integrase [Leeuwenhoekiella sp.]|nr:integrase [Leeuwenhoekiella sp.]
MATLKYFTKGTGNPSTIYLRFKHGRKYDFTKSTALLVDPTYWNNKKGSVKQISTFADKKNLQNDLNGLSNDILNKFNDKYTKGELINSEWLKDGITAYFNQNSETDLNFLIDFAEYHKANQHHKIQANGKIGVSQATIRKYSTIINKLKQFEKHKKKRLRVVEVDLKFHKEFIKYFHEVDLLSYNTIGKYLTFIKTIVKEAKRNGIKVSIDIEKSEFRPPKEKTTFVTLNPSEINRVFDYDFTKTPYLDNARDWLIIGVWSGARAGDLLSFTAENVNNGFIEYTAQKTGQKIILPLHPQVKAILEKHGGNFPRATSTQKFNDYIKTVCQTVGFTELLDGAKTTKLKKGVWRKQKGTFEKWELVSTHICRRSFATNHYGKLPTPVLMAITGHTTEKMFLNYIRKTAQDNAKVLNSFWETQEIKRDKKAVLKPVKTGTN